MDARSRFEAVWTFGLGESRSAAWKAFDRLSVADREAAISGAAAFQAAMAGRTHPPHASTYLAERSKWTYRRPSAAPTPSSESSPSKGSAGSACQRPDGSWFLKPGSPQLERWNAYERKMCGAAARGCIRPSEWPPSLQAQAAGGETAERAA